MENGLAEYSLRLLRLTLAYFVEIPNSYWNREYFL